MWMSSTKIHMGLVDSVVLSTERLCQGELCYLGHRKNGSALVCSIRFITEWIFL